MPVSLRSLLLVTVVLCSVIGAPSTAQDRHQHDNHDDHNMVLEPSGSVMNNNATVLPRDCDEIGPDYAFTVQAGTEFGAAYAGSMFGFSQREFSVEPCARVTITFVNNDQVRHQWMIHGLPKYLYPAGMFHLEAAGGQTQTGTFIVPSDDRTYLVHCDMAQHMEKGMKAQLKVGRGSGDLWSIPGLSNDFKRDPYAPEQSAWWIAGATLLGFIATMVFGIRSKS